MRLFDRRKRNTIMNTTELAKLIADQNGVPEKHVRDVLGGMLEGIARAVTAGEEVSLPGFGKFKVKDRPERAGRNPSTGEAITIAASKKVTFTPAKALRDRL